MKTFWILLGITVFIVEQSNASSLSNILSRHKRQYGGYDYQAAAQEAQEQAQQEMQEQQEQQQQEYEQQMQEQEQQREEEMQQQAQEQAEAAYGGYRYRRSLVHNQLPIQVPSYINSYPMAPVGSYQTFVASPDTYLVNSAPASNTLQSQSQALTCLDYLDMIFSLLLQDRFDGLMMAVEAQDPTIEPVTKIPEYIDVGTAAPAPVIPSSPPPIEVSPPATVAAVNNY